MEPITKHNIVDLLKDVRKQIEEREKALDEYNMRAVTIRNELDYLNLVALSLDNLTQEKVSCVEDVSYLPRKY